MATPKGTLIVTGANGGLGSATVKQIVASPEFAGYHGLYLVREAASATGLDSVLATNPSNSHDVLSMDLTDMDSVRQAAKVINSRISSGQIPPIKLLILNAGYNDQGKQAWTKDGLDITFGANYLGHWLLTLLLLQSMNIDSGRIVLRNKAFANEKYKIILRDENTFAAIAKGDWSPAQEVPSWANVFRRYGASKLFLIMMMHELQRRVDQDPNLKNISLLGVRVLIFQIIRPLLCLLMPNGPYRTTQKSASHVLRATVDSDQVMGLLPKDLYFNGLELMETSDESRDPVKRDMVWKQSIRYAGLKEGETILGNWK
ncbi:hypothetical protein HYALB_00006768 [Hymenoscyphus albidus]|uniref:Short-chain dehydrogenase n=1 Tax=Hymenoscyphus albidus TaxID=595503 RepID=A0A9N9M1V8_9HELO|nr:hypothetical protein HYALB_00006768 [Hymenoscyphus albidus]